MNTQSTSWKIGEITVTSIFEVEADSVIQAGITDAMSEKLLTVPWLQPDFVNADGRVKAVVQSFVVESQGIRLLIDPGVGNSKVRNDLPEWSQLQTIFLSVCPESTLLLVRISISITLGGTLN